MCKFLWLMIVVLVLCACQSPLDLPGGAPTSPTQGWAFARADYLNDQGWKPGYANGNIRTDQVFLQWTPRNIDDFYVAKLYRNDFLLKTFASTDTDTLTDTGLGMDTHYLYRLVTYDRSMLAIVDSMEIKTPKYYAPPWLHYEFQSATQVRIFWPNTAESANRYRLYQKAPGADDFTLASETADTSYVLTNPITGSYCFRVEASSEFEHEPLVSQDFEIYPQYQFYSPSNFQAEMILGEKVHLTWVDNSNAETRYDIERAVLPDSIWSSLAHVDADVEEYNDSLNLVNDGLFYYRVRAANSEATTDWVYTWITVNFIPTVVISLPDSPESFSSNTYSEYAWQAFEVTQTGFVAAIHLDADCMTDAWGTEGALHLISPSGNETTLLNGMTDGTISLDSYGLSGDYTQGVWYIYLTDSYGDGGHRVTNATLTITLATENTSAAR
jgi:hypothetical protein